MSGPGPWGRWHGHLRYDLRKSRVTWGCAGHTQRRPWQAAWCNAVESAPGTPFLKDSHHSHPL